MKQALVLIFLFVGSSFLAQESWVKKNEEKGVEIYIKQAECIPPHGFKERNFLIQLRNNNNYEVEVQFFIEKWNKEGCLNCKSQSNEFKLELNIKSNESLVGQCFHPLLSFFKEFNDVSYNGRPYLPLTEIRITNIQVKDFVD